ncbi:predicted protein [Plenodomus lingam JN3]|uniref:Predicted protein n=1 Tax=Leptosphaeria maculans (strain JN3 / isolate v23.1.3 / race Av1-4-5-6-7-8) TaxID=985895 RepID=E4ZYC7_LEPMJ|nr:predicted protein [Plenodomus lingam JN3]CBX96372.1 predicted protein [Plenodomus lingam JN3]
MRHAITMQSDRGSLAVHSQQRHVHSMQLARKLALVCPLSIPSLTFSGHLRCSDTSARIVGRID